MKLVMESEGGGVMHTIIIKIKKNIYNNNKKIIIK